MIWGTIGKKDWIHCAFFLKSKNTFSDPAENRTRVYRYLQHVRSLTWHNNHALLRDLVFSHVPRQMHLVQLRNVLRRTVNLSHFSLVMDTHGIEEPAIRSIFRLLHKLPYLSNLEIDLPLQGSKVTCNEQYFPVFAKLKELRIAGHWYEGFETLRPAPTTVIPWVLKYLTIYRLDMSFFRFCPDLEHLTINPSVNNNRDSETLEVKEVIVEQLQGLSKLSTVVLNVRYSLDVDVGKIVKVKGSEDQWTCPGVSKRFYTLRDVFGLTQS
ncbi:hypothetical protein KI688_000681 [Linnemannia hyalina]|uniref:Uncharacterized protein n=1 Tax=Linnemannia hyalina TaxID=64524 RepID=A0A9P7Y4S8_9FUNG|nr:hypothetical protein KI688_000681 [Linnemannia hyalina]